MYLYGATVGATLFVGDPVGSIEMGASVGSSEMGASVGSIEVGALDLDGCDDGCDEIVTVGDAETVGDVVG